MAKISSPTRLYYLQLTEVYDRPHLRGPGYLHEPKAHSSFSHRISKGSYAAVMAARDEILRGEFDFGSEYVSEVEVYSTDLHGNNARCERKPVFRVRDAGAEKPVVVATEEERFARRMAAKDARSAS
jgi:hypothetical protein